MPKFRCPNCGQHSNKFVNKCPECGYERLEGKKIKTDDGSARNSRELQQEKQLAKNTFRGGRNKNIGGADRQQSPRRSSS